MGNGIYPVGISIRCDRLSKSGYVATVEAGHHKVKHLFAFGDSRRDAEVALAQLIYDALAGSRFDISQLGAIALIETRLVRITNRSRGA